MIQIVITFRTAGMDETECMSYNHDVVKPAEFYNIDAQDILDAMFAFKKIRAKAEIADNAYTIENIAIDRIY